jgi:hypothetical protein
MSRSAPPLIWIDGTKNASSIRMFPYVFHLMLCMAVFGDSIECMAKTDAIGVPLTNANPASTLLLPGTTNLTLSVQSSSNTECRYAIGSSFPFTNMVPFNEGSGTTQHRTVISGLNPDPNVVNEVYVRCAANPAFALHLRYRCLSNANPSYPRTGNLWGQGNFADKDLANCARIDLWLGAWFSPEQIRQLRLLNPNIRILTSINAIENMNLPDDYYLKDIHGNRVEVWPGSYRLNMTKPYVAEYQARYAYQLMLDSDLMMDGCFFDNVMLTQSWQTEDIYGNAFRYDANEDGVMDDPATLDAAWKAGVLHEIETFRQLMPNAILSGHSLDIEEPGIAKTFDGISFGFRTADAIENKGSFQELWDLYNQWMTTAGGRAVTMFESSPPDQIAYGYGYAPWSSTPASTLEFARSYYPYMRFGLALTLMNNGYFAHEFGDTWHGNDWWYDELDYDLGQPLGPAERVELSTNVPQNMIENGSIESPIVYPWGWWANSQAGCSASVSRDATQAADGAASVRIDARATSGTDWHIELAQYKRALVCGQNYEVVFRARSDRARAITVSAQKGSPDWRFYGLCHRLSIGPGWQEYRIRFTATESTTDSRIQFWIGEETGTVWLDGVGLYARGPDVYRREFSNGLVLLNASRVSQTIEVGAGYRRLTGNQAPRYEYIVDDSDAIFSPTSNWKEAIYDTGEWQATAPFYHNWGKACHERTGSQGEARWNLLVEGTDTYTITAWWPAAPSSQLWSAKARYEVVAQGQVVATATLDQRASDDQWHAVAQAVLKPDDGAFVRLSSQDGKPCVADAIHVSSAARYHDGSTSSIVKLQPMDGIVLARRTPPSRTQISMTQTRDGYDVLSFLSSSQLVYNLQYKSNLLAGSWSNLFTLEGNGERISITNFVRTGSRGFYKVLASFK